MVGRFITFEGGEGTGKSTQVRRLAARLREHDIPVIETREPGGTEAAEAIRDLLLSGAIKELGPQAEALMFAAARLDHVDGLIRPSLARGDWVLCDRFFDSTRVYQGEAGSVDPAMLDSLERIAVGRSRPDLTLVLDLPAEVGLGRVASRLKESGGKPDRFEAEDAALHERRRLAFISIAAREPDRCVVVDADRSEEAVAEDIWSVVTLRFLREAA